MDILIYYNINKIKEPLEKEVLWYDPFWKKLKKFNCTQLIYKWEETEYIKDDSGEVISVEDGIKKFIEYMKKNPEKFTQTFFPEKFAEQYLKDHGYIKKHAYWRAYPETNHRESICVDKKTFEDWLRNYINYNTVFITITQVSNEGVIVNIPEDNKTEIEDFLYSLDQSGFRYEITS